MTDPTHDDLPNDPAAPGDDETLLPDSAPRSGPLAPSDDPDGGDDESTIGSPP